MDLDFALRKCRIQIKFGRSGDAENTLRQLLDDFKETDKEKVILEMLALGSLKDRDQYKDAIPVLHRLLELDIDEHTRMQATEFLNRSIAQENLQPSDPDTSKKEYLDFMEIVRSRGIFKPAGKSRLSPEFLSTTDIELAEKLAWNQNAKPPFQSWNMLRTRASTQIHSHCFANKINMRPAYHDVSKEIDEICNESLSPTMMNFYDDISADLGLIAMGLMVGVVPYLHPRMWRAYKSRCYPCGWRGSYPKGNVCVFPNC